MAPTLDKVNDKFNQLGESMNFITERIKDFGVTTNEAAEAIKETLSLSISPPLIHHNCQYKKLSEQGEKGNLAGKKLNDKLKDKDNVRDIDIQF